MKIKLMSIFGRQKTEDRRRKKGFTLIELLVVVAIIAILSLIGITIYTSTLKKARDAKRISDVDAIAKAIEVHKNGAVYNFKVDRSFFAQGTVPSDPSNHYCISGGPSPVEDISSWPITSENNCPGIWALVEDGLQLNVAYWKICARLENSTETVLRVYCRGSTR